MTRYQHADGSLVFNGAPARTERFGWALVLGHGVIQSPLRLHRLGGLVLGNTTDDLVESLDQLRSCLRANQTGGDKRGAGVSLGLGGTTSRGDRVKVGVPALFRVVRSLTLKHADWKGGLVLDQRKQDLVDEEHVTVLAEMLQVNDDVFSKLLLKLLVSGGEQEDQFDQD